MNVKTQEQSKHPWASESRRRRMCKSICGWVQVQVQAQALKCMRMWAQVQTNTLYPYIYTQVHVNVKVQKYAQDCK